MRCRDPRLQERSSSPFLESGLQSSVLWRDGIHRATEVLDGGPVVRARPGREPAAIEGAQFARATFFSSTMGGCFRPSKKPLLSTSLTPRGVGASIEMKAGRHHSAANHASIAYDFGRPSSVMRLSMEQASWASTNWVSAPRDRIRSPTIDLNLKNAFSTRPCRW